MENSDFSIDRLIDKRNKIVYAICILSVLLTALSFSKFFFNFSILYFLILLVPFFTIVYWMIKITEDIKEKKDFLENP